MDISSCELDTAAKAALHLHPEAEFRKSRPDRRVENLSTTTTATAVSAMFERWRQGSLVPQLGHLEGDRFQARRSPRTQRAGHGQA
jgi:hypothetical protein